MTPLRLHGWVLGVDMRQRTPVLPVRGAYDHWEEDTWDNTTFLPLGASVPTVGSDNPYAILENGENIIHRISNNLTAITGVADEHALLYDV